MNPLARVGWFCISKITAPLTATEYSPGQRVKIDGKHYLVRRILSPETAPQRREPIVEIHLVGDEGIQKHRMAERVLDLHRAGKIGSSEDGEGT